MGLQLAQGGGAGLGGRKGGEGRAGWGVEAGVSGGTVGRQVYGVLCSHVRQEQYTVSSVGKALAVVAAAMPEGPIRKAR